MSAEAITKKLIDKAELSIHAIPSYGVNVTDNTTMGGTLRAKVKELRKGNENQKSQADAIVKSHTFTINLEWAKTTVKDVIEIASQPTSLIVSLQTMIRSLPDETIKKIAAGETGEIVYAEQGDKKYTFKYSNKVLYVIVNSWINRPSGRTTSDPVESASKATDKLSDEQFIANVRAGIEKRFPNKTKEEIDKLVELMS